MSAPGMPDGPPVLRGTSGSIDLRTEFKPTADEYRRVSRLLMIAWIPAVAFVFLIRSPKYMVIGVGGIALFIAASIVGSLVWLPKLFCPSCHEKMDKSPGFMGKAAFGDFCPECGQAAIEKGWFYPKCTACGKRLSQGRNGRQFKIRYCTWCDAHIDDKGL
jgi:hypothetical protein